MNPLSDPDAPPATPLPSGSGKNHAPRILHNTGMLAISGLLVRGMGMVMMVILARSLGAEGYGTYQRAESFVYMFSILGSFGLDMILTREVARRGARAPEYLTGVLIVASRMRAATMGHSSGASGATAWSCS
jgi:O-antigen/teichoic acid export membrane protein